MFNIAGCKSLHDVIDVVLVDAAACVFCIVKNEENQIDVFRRNVLVDNSHQLIVQT